MQRLLEIRQAMEKLTKEKDSEVAHAQADKLLIEAMKAAVNEKITTARKRVHIGAIERAYNEIEKMYA